MKGTDEREKVRRAVMLKCHLLADGVRIDEGAFDATRSNLTRRHLYDYGISLPSHQIPYELVLHKTSQPARGPVVARVRYNRESRWSLIQRSGSHAILDEVSGDEHPVEVPASTDFRGHEVRGIPLDSIVQRLGQDLLGLVPTNYCSYYRNDGKCAFCEIVETFDDLHNRKVPYRRSIDILADASVAAAEIDSSISSITYNGGQLNGLDETVLMYTSLLSRIAQHRATANLDKTIACMPPKRLELIDGLAESGLNQYFINVETMDPRNLRTLAPRKSELGLATMLDALEYSIPVFGTGRVYSNLVYGIQTIGDSWPNQNFSSESENTAMLSQVDELILRGVVPTFTVYHSSGRNKTGPLRLSGDVLFDFTAAYGAAIWASGYIARERGAILFTMGSLPNTTYNDGWLLAELEASS